MQRRWLFATAILCGLLIAVSMAMPNRSKTTLVVEKDGTRFTQRQNLFLSNTSTTTDPTIRVSDDFKKTGVWLSPEARSVLNSVQRQQWSNSSEVSYHLDGAVKGMPKAVIDAYAKHYPALSRTTSTGYDQISGPLPGGRTLSVYASLSGAQTFLNLNLTLPRPKP